MTGTRVKVTCPSCGHVRVAGEDVRLVVASPPRAPYYLFRCPGCDRRVRRPAPAEVVAALTERGVPTVRPVPGPDAGGELASRPDTGGELASRPDAGGELASRPDAGGELASRPDTV